MTIFRTFIFSYKIIFTPFWRSGSKQEETFLCYTIYKQSTNEGLLTKKDFLLDQEFTKCLGLGPAFC